MLKKTPYIIMKMSIPNIPALMTRLETQISTLKQHYAERLGEKIFIKTDRALFNENYQSIAEFLQEIDTTLQRLQSVKFEHFEYVQLITERLIKQCALLTDSAAQNIPKSTTKKKPTRQPTKVSHAVHKLPPRERLEKYYEARSQLQEYYQQTKARAIAAAREEEKARYFTLATSYKQRMHKCQEAIDLLEEYLAFKEEQMQQEK